MSLPIDTFMVRHGHIVTYAGAALTTGGFVTHAPLILVGISTLCSLGGAISQIYVAYHKVRLMQRSSLYRAALMTKAAVEKVDMTKEGKS